MISSSELDRQVRIESKATTRDPDFGSEVVTPWATVATVWARLRDVTEMRSREATTDPIRTATRRTEVVMRYIAGITSDMRVVDLDTSRVMQIVAPAEELGRRNGLRLLCEDYGG